MATTNIELDIENITGVADANDQFVISAQKFVVASIPKELLMFALNRSSISSDGSAMPFENDSIVDVQRNGYSCKEISFSESVWATDNGSLKKSTSSFPVYWIQNDGVKIAPATDGSNGGYVFYINSPEIDDDCDLRNAVVFHAASSEFTKLGSDELPTISISAVPPDVPSISSISFSESNALSITATAPTAISLATISYTDAANSDASATAVGAITVATVAKADISGDVPSYTKPGHPAQVSFNSFFESGSLNPFDDSDPDIFSVVAVPPDIPTITASTVSFSASRPTYSKPTLSLDSAPSIGNLTISVSAPTTIAVPDISGVSVGAVTIDSLPSAPNYTTPTETISGVAWATEYPSQASTITDALAKIITSVENAEDEIEDANKMVPNIVLGVAEVAESVADTDTGSSEMQIAADAINTALDRIASYNWGDSDTFDSAAAQLTRVKAALNNAEDVINSNQPSATTDAYGALADEDVEIVQGALGIATTEINRAQSHLAEWNAILQAASTEAQGFANELQARGAWTSAKSQVWNGYFASAQAYATAAQTYLASAQGYSAEIQTRLSATPIKVQEYQAKVQDALNVFNEGNSVYQAAVQRNLQQAQINMQDAQKEADIDLQEKIQDYTLTLQKFQADVQNYQAIVNDEVQEYQQNLAGDIQVWQVERQTDLQEYASDIQNELNEFNEENTVYQAQLQISIQDAQLEDAEESKKLQQFSAEIQEYQSEVNTEVQVYTQKLQRYQFEAGNAYTAWAKTESDNLQVYQLDIQNELNEFNKDNTRYQANVQAELAKHNTDLQKASTQAQIDAADAQQEAAQTTDVDKFNKAQDQALDLANRAKQIEDDISNNNSKVAQFQSEAQHYATQVNEDVQAYTSQLQSDIQTMQGDVATEQNKLAKYQAEIGEYQAEVATETAEYQSKIQKQQVYSKESDKYYQWANAEVQMYIKNNSKMIGLSIASQSQQQEQQRAG